MRLDDAASRGGIACILALIAAALSGCGGGGAGMDSVANVLAFGSPTAPALPAKPTDVKVHCPPVEVLDGTASMRSYAGANENPNVRYQYSLGDVARECTLQGNQIAIKVGVEGRVLIGPNGSAGTFTAPVRVAIRRESDHKAAVSQLYRVPVTVPQGATQAPFSLVTDPLLVPLIGVENADDDYTVVVGFDEAGGAAPAVARHKRRSAR